MKYIIGVTQHGGYRTYGAKIIEVADITRKPTLEDAYANAAQCLLGLAKSIHRRCTYEWAFETHLVDGCRGVEIGVDFGDGIAQFLSRRNPAMITGVDPWLSQGWDPWFSQPQKEMDYRHEFVCSRFKDANNVTIVRAISDEFFERFFALGGEGTLDFVHVDGDHREEQATKDLINADKALRVGGIMLIDDVFLESWTGSVAPAVKAALQDKKYKALNIDSDPLVLQKKE